MMLQLGLVLLDDVLFLQELLLLSLKLLLALLFSTQIMHYFTTRVTYVNSVIDKRIQTLVIH